MTNERSTGTSSKLATLLKMMGLVKPLSGFMALAVVSGTLAYLAVQFIPVLGGYAILDGLGLDVPIPSATISLSSASTTLLRLSFWHLSVTAYSGRSEDSARPGWKAGIRENWYL